MDAKNANNFWFQQRIANAKCLSFEKISLGGLFKTIQIIGQQVGDLKMMRRAVFTDYKSGKKSSA